MSLPPGTIELLPLGDQTKVVLYTKGFPSTAQRPLSCHASAHTPFLSYRTLPSRSFQQPQFDMSEGAEQLVSTPPARQHINNNLKSLWDTVKVHIKDGTLPTVAVARLTSVLLLHPLDTFKSRLQHTTATSARATTVFARNVPPFVGLPAAILGQVPYTALSLVLFLHLKDRLPSIPESRRAISAALISDSVAALWLTPFESMKLRVQTSVQPCVSRAFRVGGLYSGLNAELLRDVPYRSAHLALLAALAVREKRRDVRGTLGSACIAAAVAIVTNPLDVVRTRVMAQNSSQSSKLYSSAVHCAGRIIKHEGMTALFKGAVPRAVYMGASVLIFSTAYTAMERYGSVYLKKTISPLVSRASIKKPEDAKSAVLRRR